MSEIYKKAFTLIELIVVMAILVILGSAAFISAGVIRDQIAFVQAYQGAQGYISEARTRSLTGESFEDLNDYDGDGDFADLILPNGYLVNFVTDGDGIIEISLYADLYSSVTVGDLDANDEHLKSITLSDDIEFELLIRDKTGADSSFDTATVDDFKLLYTTPDASYTLVGELNKSIQIRINQVDENDGSSKRDNFLLLHFLYGIPEILDAAYFS